MLISRSPDLLDCHCSDEYEEMELKAAALIAAVQTAASANSIH